MSLVQRMHFFTKRVWNDRHCTCLSNKSLSYLWVAPNREATYPVDGTHFGWPWCDGRFRSGVSCHWIYLGPQEAVSLGFNPLWRGWVYRPASLLEECRRGPRHFWKCREHVGFGPAPGPTLKKALCHNRLIGGTEDKYHHIYGLHLFWAILYIC